MSYRSVIHIDYQISRENDEAPPTIPERTFLLAMIERAVNDLAENAEISQTRSAIKWITSKPLKERRQNTSYISFQACVEYLDLGFPEERQLVERALYAQKALDNPPMKRAAPTSIRHRVTK